MMSGNGSSRSEPWKAMIVVSSEIAYKLLRDLKLSYHAENFSVKKAGRLAAHAPQAVGEAGALRGADRHRERVGRVGLEHDGGQAEQDAHHAFDLRLRGAPVAGDRALHLGRRILARRQT